MKLTKLTHCYHLSIASKAHNQVNLCRIASVLQQGANHQTINAIGDFLAP